MHDGIAIRPFANDDRDVVLAVTEAAWEPVFAITETQVPGFVLGNFFPNGWMPRQLADVADLLEKEPVNFFVAEIGGAIAGFVGIRLHPEDRMGEVYIIAVSPKFQRRGVARALIAHSEDIVRASGLKMMMIETIGDEGHRPARKSYEGMNYVRWPVARYFKPLDG